MIDPLYSWALDAVGMVSLVAEPPIDIAVAVAELPEQAPAVIELCATHVAAELRNDVPPCVPAGGAGAYPAVPAADAVPFANAVHVLGAVLKVQVDAPTVSVYHVLAESVVPLEPLAARDTPGAKEVCASVFKSVPVPFHSAT